MAFGRVVSTALAAVTVGGCAVIVVGMTRSSHHDVPTAQSPVANLAPSGAPTSIPALLPAAAAAASSSSAAAGPAAPVLIKPPAPESTASSRGGASSTAAATTSQAAPSTSVVPRPPALSSSTAPPAPRRATVAPPPAPPRTTPVSHPAPRPVHRPAAQRGVALPLGFTTGTATRVITVVAQSTYSTTATLQAWTKAPGGGWLRWGAAVTAHVGSDGLSTAPSESRSATPIGSFTLTRAFGHYANPGTPLPYVHTSAADWWISQSGPLYNTLQHCWSNCPFTQGDPNEHLYYETPYYNYAVVIDYNTRNAGPVRQGAGSAFFLHVTDYRPTAGCVAIPQASLLPIMRWLSPAAHPRILIGVA